MTLVYASLALNFIFMISSWVLFFKIFQKKADIENLHSQIKSVREDVDLVTKNPSAARRKLKSSK